MGMMTVRNIPDEVHDALRAQAKAHGRSAEAEVRVILEAAVKPETRIRMGDALAAVSQQVDLTDDDAAALEHSLKNARDKKPAKPVSFD